MSSAFIRPGTRRTVPLLLFLLLLFAALASGRAAVSQASSASTPNDRAESRAEEATMIVQYLEIVTPAVDETCAALAAAHGASFSEPVPELGNARTAELKGGGRLGVRAPMRETEKPVVRPYLLVDDIEAAVEAAKKAGAEMAMQPMQIPGQGTFAIHVLGGIEHGLWQMPAQP